METDNRVIPFTITKLIIGFFLKTLSEEETEQLDDWINTSRDNMEMFGECCGLDKEN